MANISLGKITVALAGTPVRLTSNQSDPTKSLLVHALLIQPHPANTGKVYIGTNSVFTKNGAGQIAWLPIPSSSVAPAFSETVSYAQDAVETNDIWIDSDNNGDSVIAAGVLA